jgi:diketogulonate reductase-like aldo/keto reductase
MHTQNDLTSTMKQLVLEVDSLQKQVIIPLHDSLEILTTAYSELESKQQAQIKESEINK